MQALPYFFPDANPLRNSTPLTSSICTSSALSRAQPTFRSRKTSVRDSPPAPPPDRPSGRIDLSGSIAIETMNGVIPTIPVEALSGDAVWGSNSSEYFEAPQY